MYSLLRFGGVTVRHNPKELTVINNKGINEYSDTENRTVMQRVIEKPSVIKGTGELYGDGCFEMYSRLMRMQIKNIPQKLCIPGMGVYTAVITKLSAKAGAHAKLITIEFEFRTAGDRYAKKITSNNYTCCRQGETLWDIAYRCEVCIDTLVKLNTGIRNILFPPEGKKMRLR